MKIVKDTDDVLVIEHKPVWMWSFLGVFALGGLVYLWKVVTGQSDDYFGLFIFLTMPAGAALAFCPLTTLRIDKVTQRVSLTHARPFNLSTEMQFALDDLKGIDLVRLRGEGVNGSGRVLMRLKDKNVGLTLGSSQFYHNDAVKALVSRIQSFAQIGALPD